MGESQSRMSPVSCVGLRCSQTSSSTCSHLQRTQKSGGCSRTICAKWIYGHSLSLLLYSRLQTMAYNWEKKHQRNRRSIFFGVKFINFYFIWNYPWKHSMLPLTYSLPCILGFPWKPAFIDFIFSLLNCQANLSISSFIWAASCCDGSKGFLTLCSYSNWCQRCTATATGHGCLL